jgi:perosamine synthetase
MEPWFGAEEKAEINRYLDEGGWITEFKRTAQFESELARYTGARHCVVVNNGTVSLTLAALAVGLQPGDEVIVPNYTMIATPNSVKMLGCVPVFVDVEPETLCLALRLAEQAITPRTRALMLVTANGRAPRAGIAAFEQLCAARGITLIEDAAQSLGSRFPDGRHCGTAGALGSFSFSAPKVISTGQGGALITNSDELAGRLRKLKDFGRTGGGNDLHDSIGYNFKFTELQACVGLAQMGKLAWRVERKKEIYRLYRQELSDCPQVRFFTQNLIHTTPWFIDTMVERRSELIDHLNMNGVGARVMYPPINRQNAYRMPGAHPVSDAVGLHGLWLPSATQLLDSQIRRICALIREFYHGRLATSPAAPPFGMPGSPGVAN